MSESNLWKKLRRAVKKLSKTKILKLHNGVFASEVGTPDCLICHRGFTLLLELKDPHASKAKRTPKAAQKLRQRQWGNAGAISCTIESVDEALEIIEHLDDLLNDHDDIDELSYLIRFKRWKKTKI